MAYWEFTPPVHVAVAAYLGLGKESKGPKKSDMSAEQFAASLGVLLKPKGPAPAPQEGAPDGG